MHHRNLAVAAISVVLVLCAALAPTNSMAQVAAEATISVSPNPAHPSDTVTIRGSGPGSAAEGGCGLRVSPGDGDAFDNGSIAGSCAIDDAGTISGSFAVPADLGRTSVTVEVCVASCLDVDVPGPVASASLQVEPVVDVAVVPVISVSPNPAHPSDTVTISGSGPGSAAEGGCGLRVGPGDGDAFDNGSIAGSCAIDDAGAISGSFAVPADLGRTSVTVEVCVASCRDVEVAGPVASASLVVEPAVVTIVTPSISVNPTTALPGGTVTIAGTAPGSGPAVTCDVAVDDGATNAACAVDGAGAITGSFTVPADAQPGSVTVTVCEMSCQGTDSTRWRASAPLVIGSTSVISTATTDQPPATVQIPDVTSMTVQEAETVITQAGLGVEVSGDRDGRVREQDPTAGTMVPPATSVRLTTADPVPPVPPNRFLPAAIAAVVMLMIGGLALTVRYRVRRRRELRWVDEHVNLNLEPGLRVNRAQPADPDGVDHEIKVMVNPQSDKVSVLEVQR